MIDECPHSLIDYTLFTCKREALQEHLHHLYQSESSRSSVTVRLTLFQPCSSNREYVSLRSALIAVVEEIWGKERRPIVSLVAQPVLEGEIALEVHSCTIEASDRVNYFCAPLGGRAITVEGKEGALAFVGEVHGDPLHDTIADQSTSLFERAVELLEYIAPIERSHIVRQWNYIERITDEECSNQHYQLFNNARTTFYATTAWECGYPAATGIGMDCGGVVVDMDLFLPAPDGKALVQAIDNRLQVAAHIYSPNVLVDAHSLRSTPKFERAKSIESQWGKQIYISGTAAIRGEESFASASVEEQTLLTLENIEQLIDRRGEIQLLRVYVKRSEDYIAVKQHVEAYCPMAAILYLQAGVCREELLVELEGISQQACTNSHQ